MRIVTTVPAQTPGVRPPDAICSNDPAEFEQLRSLSQYAVPRGRVELDLMNLRGRDPRLQGAIVSAEFFEMLARTPVAWTRDLGGGRSRRCDAPVILLSYDTWRRHFGGDPEVIGRNATFDPVLGPPVRTDTWSSA